MILSQLPSEAFAEHIKAALCECKRHWVLSNRTHRPDDNAIIDTYSHARNVRKGGAWCSLYREHRCGWEDSMGENGLCHVLWQSFCLVWLLFCCQLYKGKVWDTFMAFCYQNMSQYQFELDGSSGIGQQTAGHIFSSIIKVISLIYGGETIMFSVKYRPNIGQI